MTLATAIDELVPVPDDAFGDWEDVLRRAEIARTQPAVSERLASRRRLPRRRRLVAAALLALLVIFFASPAFGLLLDLIGRKDVAFDGKPAPVEIKRDFYDFSVGAPRGLSPEAIAGAARRIGVFRGAKGKRFVLYVAPTHKSGYCWIFQHSMGSCRKPGPSGRGAPHAIVAQWGVGQHRGGPVFAQQVGGAVAVASARALSIEYEDGTSQRIPFVWVSKPIDAGFFLFAPSPAHERAGARVSAVTALDARGRVVAREPASYEQFFSHAPIRPPKRHAMPPLAPPSAPLQRGSAGGVTVTVGSNRVASFDTSRAADPDLLRGASWGCFKFTRYHEVAPFGIFYAAQARHGTAIDLNGVAAPYDGCEVQATYGRTWPDRLGSHAAVEIAFTARARRYFADRAAARDLALFVRARKHHHAVAPPARIRIRRNGAETTFLERSPTGRAFSVTLRGSHVVRQNVRPFALVF
jgi:hypothetical protein